MLTVTTPTPYYWMVVLARVRSSKEGKVGLLRFIFGQDNRSRAQRDSYRPCVIGKNLVSPINTYGTCFGCDGTGSRTLECRACNGSGMHSGQCRRCEGLGRLERAAQQCFGCHGKGQNLGSPCRRCDGTGNYKPAVSESCRRCNGSGRFAADCRRCNGTGSFTVTCRKCDGSGWHRHKR